MTLRNYSAIDWSEWLSWVLATAIGSAIGFSAIALIVPPINSLANVDEDKLFAILLAPLLGLLIGGLQWLVLRRRIPRGAWWLAATVIGYIAALMLASLSADLQLNAKQWIPDDILLMAVLGLVVGAPQYLVLRKHFPKAGWWLFASGIGMLSFLLGGAIPAHNLIELVRLGAYMGALSGAVTGIAWVWLLRSARSISSIY